MMQHTIWIFKTFSPSISLRKKQPLKRICPFAKEFFSSLSYSDTPPQHTSYPMLLILSVSASHTHTNAGGISARGRWLCTCRPWGQWLASSARRSSRPAVLLAHAHFTLSQWHGGLTRAPLLCHRSSQPSCYPGEQANRDKKYLCTVKA